MARITKAQYDELEAKFEMANTKIAALEASLESGRAHYLDIKQTCRALVEENLAQKAEIADLVGKCRHKESMIQVLRKRPTRAELEQARDAH